MNPPWGHSRRLFPTLDTGEDLVGLLQNTHSYKIRTLLLKIGEERWAKENKPDELPPLLHEEQRNHIQNIRVLRKQTQVRGKLSEKEQRHCLVLTWGHFESMGRFFSWKRLSSWFFWSSAIILLTASLSFSSCSNVWTQRGGDSLQPASPTYWFAFITLISKNQNWIGINLK